MSDSDVYQQSGAFRQQPDRDSERSARPDPLERIAGALESLQTEMRAMREALLRIANRTGRGDE